MTQLRKAGALKTLGVIFLSVKNFCAKIFRVKHSNFVAERGYSPSQNTVFQNVHKFQMLLSYLYALRTSEHGKFSK